MQQRISKMDLTKLQGSSFNESGFLDLAARGEQYREVPLDTNQGKMTASVGDLLSVTRVLQEQPRGKERALVPQRLHLGVIAFIPPVLMGVRQEEGFEGQACVRWCQDDRLNADETC